MSLLSRRKALFYLGTSSIGLVFNHLLGCQSHYFNQSTSSSLIETKQEAIDLMAQVKRLKQIAPSKYSNQYQPPKPNELKQFRNVANAINVGKFDQAAKLAKELNYRLIKFRESSTQ